MSKLHIVTVATESKYYYPYLVESCKRNNSSLITLGFKQKWKGLSWKLTLMKEYLLSIPSDDIVCFVDGYDVVCTRDLNDMIDCFNKMINKHKCKIIVGYHYNINKFFRHIENLFYGNTINSGTYIGKSKDILNMLTQIKEIDMDDKSEDQVLFNKYYNTNKKDIYIDSMNQLFSTLHSYKRIELDEFYRIKNNKVFLKDTNIEPFFIHAPNSNYLDNIIIKLGYNYDYTNKVKDIIISSSPSTLDRLIKIYIPNIKDRTTKIINIYRYKILFIIIFIIFIFDLNLNYKILYI